MRFSPSSWIGWFPVLFYTTAFIGDLHKRSSSLPLDDPGLDAEATRLGTRALFFSSLVSLAGNVFLPLVVAESDNDGKVFTLDDFQPVRVEPLFSRQNVLHA